MEKDSYGNFDYEAFMEFMRSMQDIEFVFVDHSPFATQSTQDILDQMDELEADVATRPCYTNAEDMMNAIKGM
mgnify:CR=1 FL=1|jgi:hypothetical protein